VDSLNPVWSVSRYEYNDHYYAVKYINKIHPISLLNQWERIGLEEETGDRIATVQLMVKIANK
jgi:hypothetical protein